MTKHMTMKRFQFYKFRKQFNIRLTLILNNKEHKDYALVDKWAGKLSESADVYFTVIFNVLLRHFLIQSLSFILTKPKPEKSVSSPTNSPTRRNTVIESLQGFKSVDSSLDEMERKIRIKDPIFLATQLVKVRKAFFKSTMVPESTYKLESMRNFSKLEASISRLDYCRQITEIITKFTDRTGLDIQGMDEIKLRNHAGGKERVPSLRYLEKTIGSSTTKEELESIAKLKDNKAIAEVADTMKRRRRFDVNLRGDFVDLLIVEMAKHLDYQAESSAFNL